MRSETKKPQRVRDAGASEDNVKTSKEMNVMSKSNTAAANVIPFEFSDKPVRAVLIDDQPWFCAADVCAVLGYANSRKAVADNCREAGVTASDISSGGQKRRVTFISEGNLYRLIIKSRKDEAQRFESWVCDEVLPAIRKHGRYEDAKGKMTTLVGDVIGSTGEIVLDRVIDQKGYRIDPALQRSFKHTMKSRLRTRFNVQKTSLIPADQLADACNFIAAYALEGEFLPKQDEPTKQGTMLTDHQLYDVYFVSHHFERLYEIFKRSNLHIHLGALGSRIGSDMVGHFLDGYTGVIKLKKLAPEFEAAQRRLGLNQCSGNRGVAA